jgi:hypothetical protein
MSTCRIEQPASSPVAPLTARGTSALRPISSPPHQLTATGSSARGNRAAGDQVHAGGDLAVGRATGGKFLEFGEQFG